MTLDGLNDACAVTFVNLTQILCVTPVCPEGVRALNVAVNGVPATSLTNMNFSCSQLFTPVVESVNPTSFPSDDNVMVITGTQLGGAADSRVKVTLGGHSCHVTYTSDTMVNCTLASATVGDMAFKVDIHPYGYAAFKQVNDFQLKTYSPSYNTFYSTIL